MRIDSVRANFPLTLPAFLSLSLSRQWMRVCLGVLLATVFMSALGLIYVKDLNRRLFIAYQTAERETTHQTMLWGKRLLEVSALSTEERVQSIASQQLDMTAPTAINTVLLTVSSPDT